MELMTRKDTGALVKSGGSHVIDSGKENIMFTIITDPEWTTEAHMCYYYPNKH